MDKPKSKKLKWALLLIAVGILGVVGIWIAINFSGLWKNITFDKEDNVAAYEQAKSQENDKEVTDRLEIPALNVIANLFYPGNTWDLYRGFGNGVGHMPGTAMPGETGNVAFFGHSSGRGGSYYETIFSTLHRLENGDEVLIYREGKIYKYVVESKKIVNSNDFSILEQGDGKKISLVTCWPIGTDWQRYVVIANQTDETIEPTE